MAVALLPCAALADSPPDVTGAPVSLKLDLTGTIESHCGFLKAPEQSASLGDLTAAGSIALGFTLDCNAPFTISVRSGNGALANRMQAPTAFLASLDYLVGISVVTDLAPVSGQCPASALSSPSCTLSAGLSSGDGVSIGTDGALTVSWTAPSQQLLAGSYQDQITLTVEVRV